MLTGHEFWSLIEHIIPVYVLVFLGWGLYKYKFITPVHTPGINRFVSLIGIPFYAFHLLAFNDPYQISMPLVGADVIQKATAFGIGVLYWAFAKDGKIDHVINFFMLATLPNTVLIGDSLLDPLYGDGIHGNVVTIIFLQVILWYNFTIAMYETRIVLKEFKDKADAEYAEAELQWQREQLGISSHKSAHSIVVVGNGGRESLEMENGQHHFVNLASSAVLERTSSAPARVSFSKVVPILREPCISKVDEGTSMEEFPGHRDIETLEDTRPYDPFSLISGDPPSGRETNGLEGHEQNIKETEESRSGTMGVVDPAVPRTRPERPRVNMVTFCSLVAYKVFNRLKYVPLTFASVAGFVYSLCAYKFNWTMPYYVQTSIELVSDGAVGMALFILGLSWAMSGKLVSCGWKRMSYGMVVRFIVGPFIMIVAALAVRLKGNNYRFAVLQAVIPQGVISFVLAKEYNLAVYEFSTAVVFQLLVFIPIVVIYDIVLGAA